MTELADETDLTLDLLSQIRVIRTKTLCVTL